MGIIAGGLEDIENALRDVQQWIDSIETNIIRAIVDPLLGEFKWAGFAAQSVYEQLLPVLVERLTEALEKMTGFLNLIQDALGIFTDILDFAGKVVDKIEDTIESVGDFLGF